MTSLSGADELSDPPPSRVPADHPGVNELFAVLAYGEVAAFYRLTEEARMAPDLRGPDLDGQHGGSRDGAL